MYKLYNFACPGCAHQFEDLIAPNEPQPACPQCGQPTEQQHFSYNPSIPPDPHWSEVFRKDREMRNKMSGRVPWRKSSWSQTD